MSSEITVDCECTSEAFGAGKRQSADRENENPELIRYAADIIRKYADGLSHDDRSVKEICEENSQNIA